MTSMLSANAPGGCPAVGCEVSVSIVKPACPPVPHSSDAALCSDLLSTAQAACAGATIALTASPSAAIAPSTAAPVTADPAAAPATALSAGPRGFRSRAPSRRINANWLSLALSVPADSMAVVVAAPAESVNAEALSRRTKLTAIDDIRVSWVWVLAMTPSTSSLPSATSGCR